MMHVGKISRKFRANPLGYLTPMLQHFKCGTVLQDSLEVFHAILVFLEKCGQVGGLTGFEKNKTFS